MTESLKRLNPNVVFVTAVACVAIAAFVGRHEYQIHYRSDLEKECAEQALWLAGKTMEDSSSAAVAFSKLCVDAGGAEKAKAWIFKGRSARSTTETHF